MIDINGIPALVSKLIFIYKRRISIKQNILTAHCLHKTIRESKKKQPPYIARNQILTIHRNGMRNETEI